MIKLRIYFKKYLPVCAVFFAVFAFSCARKLTPDDFSPRETSLIIWAHADIQPNVPDEKTHYEIAVKDLKNLPFVPDMAIVAGDLVHKRDSSQYYWDWMKPLRSETGIPLWFEIAGNHDQDDPSYAKNSGKPWHYAVRSGNVLFIFLSNETRNRTTVISDGAFEWWKDLVINNQDSIIVTITHTTLSQSGLFLSTLKSMSIKDSKRFWEVIKKYRVDLWISAHTHFPNYVPIMKTSRCEECDTFFLDVSSIHKDFASPVESWILIFKGGSRSLLCLARNHEKSKFYWTSFSLNLPKPFVLGETLMISQYQPQ